MVKTPESGRPAGIDPHNNASAGSSKIRLVHSLAFLFHIQLQLLHLRHQLPQYPWTIQNTKELVEIVLQDVHNSRWPQPGWLCENSDLVQCAMISVNPRHQDPPSKLPARYRGRGDPTPCRHHKDCWPYCLYLTSASGPS